MVDPAQGPISASTESPALSRISAAATLAELEQLKVALLGKKGAITAQLKALSALDPARLP